MYEDVINRLDILELRSIFMVVKNFFADNLFIIIIIVAVSILSTLLVSFKPKKQKKQEFEKPCHDPLLINQDEISDKEEIQKLAFNILKEIKIAKMNYDLDTIKNITTENIFNLYKQQINTLKQKNYKNIVQNIKYLKSYITNINTNGNTQVINLRIIIECYDFVVESNNTPISGKYNQKVIQTYEIEIKKDKETQKCLIQKLDLLYERYI